MRKKKNNLRNLLLCIAFLFAAMLVPKTMQAAESSNENYMDISDYRSGSTYTYPTKEGYVFAGWYQDANYEKAIGTKTKNGYAYAKFVDENVLRVKCQITSNTAETDSSTNLNMVTSVDSENYTSVGFRTQFDKYDITNTTDTVYETIYGFWGENEVRYDPTVFSDKSRWFAGYMVSDFPSDYFDTLITITPMWTTLDGTTVTGIAKTFTITDAIHVSSGDAVAKIGDTYYPTLAKAFTAANAATEDVTITLLTDYESSENHTFGGKDTNAIDSANTITLDGAGYTIKTMDSDRLFTVQKREGTSVVQNLTIQHEQKDRCMRIDGSSAVKLINVDLTATALARTSTSNAENAVIYLYYHTTNDIAFTDVVDLTLTETNITLTGSLSDKDTYGWRSGAIFVGGESTSSKRNANITLNDSKVSVTGDCELPGLLLSYNTNADIKLRNSSISAANNYAIYARTRYSEDTLQHVGNADIYVLDGSTVTSSKTDATVFEGYNGLSIGSEDAAVSDLQDTIKVYYESEDVAKIGNAYYSSLADAVAAANAATQDVTIEVLSDLELSGEITINNTNNKNITINGNGHNLTTMAPASGTKLGFSIVQTEGTITFNDMKITHNAGNALVRTRTAGDSDSIAQDLTLNFNDVDIYAENDVSKYYPWSVFNLADAGTVTLNLTRTDVKMTISTTDDGSKWSVIRVCDAASQKAYINMTDSNIDATGAEKRAGIAVLGKNDTEANITLLNSTIKTKNQYPIYVYGTSDKTACTVRVDKDSTLEASKNADMTTTPIASENEGTLTIVDYYVVAKIENKIGNSYYTTLTEAVADANAYGENVTIELINDIDSEAFSQININNEYGYTITLDGNGHSISTTGGSNSIEVRQGGTFELKDIDFYHQGTNALVRTRQAVTLKASDINIYAKEDIEGVFTNYLFHIGSTGTTYLNLDNVDVTVVNQYVPGSSAGVIHTGWPSEIESNTLYLTMTDCDFDLKAATATKGIQIQNHTTAYIDITNSTIATMDTYCIRPNGQELLYTGCTFSSLDADYNASPIEGYNAMIGNTCYTLTDAITIANAATEDTIIKLIGDTGRNYGVAFSQLKFGSSGDDATGKTITLDGNGHGITTSGDSNSMEIYRAGGTVELKNLTIYHKGTNALARTRSAMTLNVTDVVIDATNGTENTEKTVGVCEHYLFNLSGTTGTTYLNMDSVEVDMVNSIEGSVDAAVIRNGTGSANAEIAYITLTDCDFDLTQATGRTGIRILDDTTAYIEMTNTNIATMDEYCIRPNGQSLTISTDCKLTSLDATRNSQPIEGYKALVETTGGAHTWYSSLQKAFTGVANYTEEDVAITMWADDSATSSTDLNQVNGVAAAINSADNTLTFDGNGYKRTMSSGSVHMFVFRKTVGQIVLKNMDMDYKGYRYAIRIDGGIQFDLENVNLYATTNESDDYETATNDYQYSLIYFNGADNTEATLNMKDVKITMDVNIQGASDDLGPQNGVIYSGGENRNRTKTININMENTVIDAVDTNKRPGICIECGITANITMKNSSIKTNDYYAIYAGKDTSGKYTSSDTNLTLTKDSVLTATDTTYNSDVYSGMSIGGALVNWVYSDATYTNRVLMLSDVHYMPDESKNDYTAKYPDLTMHLSNAFGNILGYTSTQRMTALKSDISTFINGLSDKTTVKGILTLGDLSTDNYSYSNMPENYVLKYKTEVMDKFGYPAYALAGNHDSYPNSIWNDEIFGYDRQYSVVIGDAAFIMLDTYSDLTAVDGGGSDYTGVDTSWLETEIAKYSDKQIFICSHYIDVTADNTAFAKILSENDNVVCMFMGHSHGNTLALENSLNNEFLMNVSAYSYKSIQEQDSTYNFQYFDEAWAWGFGVLEWNDTEAHYYHVKYSHEYTGIDYDNKDAGTQTIIYPETGKYVIEDEITIKFK